MNPYRNAGAPSPRPELPQPSDPPSVIWVIVDVYGSILDVRDNERSAVEYIGFWQRQRPTAVYKLFTYGTLAEWTLANEGGDT